MKLIVSPKYKHLSDALSHIDQLFDASTVTLRNGKNAIRLIQLEGIDLCVKHYGHSSWRNRIAVKIYKASKGKKAYNNAALLRERGFMTQEPVAYVAYRQNLLQQSMYFVSIHANFHHSLSDLPSLTPLEQKEIIRAYAHYTFTLHQHNFVYRAHFKDNILFDKVNGRFQFAILDTNGLRTENRISVKKGCRNIALLSDDPKIVEALVKVYAEYRKADEATCLKYIQ